MFKKLIIIFKMNCLYFLLLVFLVSFGSSLTWLRLSTIGNRTLNVGDQLISTLGLFKATLERSGCNIAVYQFNISSNIYQRIGTYSSAIYSGNCNFITIQNGMLQIETGQPYLITPNNTYNYSTIFTIDDEGVMRLISSHMKHNMVDIVSSQATINKFQTRGRFIKPLSQYSVGFTDIFQDIVNDRKWRFSAQFGQLTISHEDDPSISIVYIYSTVTVRDSRIYDFRNVSFPGVLFNNISFEPRCSDPQSYIDFKPPYVFVANQYWPSVTVYEQGGYKILDIWLGNFPQYNTGQNKTQINYYNFYSPCPKQTFQYQGNCLPSCPLPYYHQIKGQIGYCVLSCEQYSLIDQIQKTCSCSGQYEWFKLNPTRYIQNCPINSNPTPFGCACTVTGFYYDSSLTFTCVQICPSSTIAINNVCMKCPVNCLQCNRDKYNRQFLQCIVCNNRYTLTNGQCVISCPINNGICTICQDRNCADCSTSQFICNKCNLMYSLRNGICVSQCSVYNEHSVYSPGFSTSCLPSTDPNCKSYLTSFYRNVPFIKCDQCTSGYLAHFDKCVSQCPSNYYPLNGYCVCSGGFLTINDQCENLPGCPIMMSFDSQSSSCISCPFGCMSCANTRQCTSCNPGYFLYISPQNILCRRKNPLFPCNQQYSWQRSTTCAITNYQDPNLGMTLCYQTVSNCQICIPQKQICVFCQPNYFIYNNTCITFCPVGLIPYDNTCILPEISNCFLPHLLSIHQQALITQDNAQASQSYKYYTYDGQQRANDPIGYIPYFQQLTTQKNDGIPRETNFYQPSWICLKCNDTYGLSDDFKFCLSCPPSCPGQLCYMARPDSCVNPFTPPINQTCPPGQFVDPRTGNCLLNCSGPNQHSYILNGIQYCGVQSKNYVRVDSSIFQMNNGSKLVFFVFSDKLNVNSSTRVTIQGINQITPTSLAPDGNILAANAQVQSPILVPIQNGQYVQLNNQNYNAFVLNLSQVFNNLATSPTNLANVIYGAVQGAEHTFSMTTWLAYIGYVMAVAVIFLHVIFIGNQLLYKVDNLLIFVQTIFYFQFVNYLGGKLLSQFYYGWSFAHARFLPNLFKQDIPDGYVETAPITYMIFNIDGNYFRNAGFSLAWLLIYIACWIVVVCFIWLIIHKLFKKHEAWHEKIALQSLIGGFQFFSMNLVFFSVSQLAYSSKPQQSSFQNYYQASQGLAITTLCVIIIYTFLRMLYSPLGGLYMLKRCVFAIILVFSFNYPLLIIPFVFFEFFFAISRHIIQNPMSSLEILFIWAQSLLFIGCYLLLFLCLDSGVNTLIISIFIFIFIVYLAYDLTTLYLESRNQFPEGDLSKDYEEIGKTLSYIARLKPYSSSTERINNNSSND